MVCIQFATPRSIREARRKAAKDRDKHTINALRHQVWWLEWEVARWESWYSALKSNDDQTEDDVGIVLETLHANRKQHSNVECCGKQGDARYCSSWGPESTAGESPTLNVAQATEDQDHVTHEGVIDKVMEAIHASTLKEWQAILLEGEPPDGNGAVAACENCSQNLDDNDFFASFFDHFVTSEYAIADEDEQFILYEVLEDEFESMTADKQKEWQDAPEEHRQGLWYACELQLKYCKNMGLVSEHKEGHQLHEKRQHLSCVLHQRLALLLRSSSASYAMENRTMIAQAMDLLNNNTEDDLMKMVADSSHAARSRPEGRVQCGDPRASRREKSGFF